MKKFCGSVLTVLMVGHVLQEIAGQCQSSGFTGCECNIMEACDTQGKPRPKLDNKLTGYSPSGLEQFGRFLGQNQNLAYLCEDGAVATLYDCENRTPIYSATMLNEQQLNAGYCRPHIDFRLYRNLDKHYQQQYRDYERSSKVNICYKQRATGHYLIDSKWYNALNSGEFIPAESRCYDSAGKVNAAIHKGHLVAAAYARGNKTRIAATFTYINCVPQFGEMNSGIWNVEEQALLKWGREKCANHNGITIKNVRMHIIVGVIPSTYHSNEPRFFSASRFSDYQGEEYRINVPRIMWTAACCTFQLNGASKPVTRNTFFAVENTPRAVEFLVFSGKFFKEYASQKIVLFPAQPDCDSEDNYLKLR